MNTAMCRLILAAIAMAGGAASVIAAPSGVTADMLRSWDVFVAGAPAGAETVTAVPGALSAAGGFTYQGIGIESEYSIGYDAAGGLVSYKAGITAAGKKTEITAAASGKTVTVKILQGGNLLAQKDLPLTDATVLLDNNIASQYRQLSRFLDPASGAKTPLQLLVPSAMSVLAVDAAIQKGITAWTCGAAQGSAVRWQIGSALVPPISVYQDVLSREILRVDIASANVRFALTGLSLAQDAAGARAPAYLDATTVAEKELTVRTGSFSMGATLAYPRQGRGPFPGVLLVAGSGPNDRDETVGPNKPFRDIAVALANRGFAVLRFDKRTYAYRADAAALSVPGMTVKDEFIDDTVSAFRLLAAERNVDARRLSIVGHSLGAWGLPFIVEGLGPDAARIRHLVFLAPAGRDWGAMLLRQLKFQLSLAPDSAAAGAAVTELEKRLAEYKSTGSFSAGFIGASAFYWNDLFRRDPVTMARGISTDKLFVRGEKDIQVDADDLRSWQTALAGRKNAAFTTLPGINHLLMETEGRSTGAEYYSEGFVAPTLLDLVAARLKE
jgi:uncharacterized protein